jgi:DNA-binding NarL/FixJ family response regulator
MTTNHRARTRKSPPPRRRVLRKKIADALFIRHATARTQTRNILRMLGVTSRAAAVAYGLQHGLI